jgi:polyisoprenyl-teichoic acid--peptidoglycan teichoic acid transferase
MSILLCGAHEKNTDTIMILHMDQTSGNMALMSLPRDLFYRGKKINDTYRTFGPEQLMSDISKITGLTIGKYVVIDMYAFISAVDILGGIDINLPEDLIDPTYRVKDDGIWSTLFYRAGSYRFGGIEALRVARSRHYSSDFGRTERQQQIIGGMIEKAQGLNLGDTGVAYDLVRTLLAYVDTNFSALEIVELLLRHRNASIEQKLVLSTANVLYHTYSNLYYLGKSRDEVDDTFNKGAWILLPRDNDWNIIRWFVRSFIEGEHDGRYGTQEATG